MTYYEDLSKYDYLPSGLPMVNVGWLASGYDFPVGESPAGLVDNLLLLAANPENVMRGTHDCEFCDQESPLRMFASATREWVWLGDAEIHATGVDGQIYAAPSLVVHYVDAHGYLPPREFISAVDATVRREEFGSAKGSIST